MMSSTPGTGPSAGDFTCVVSAWSAHERELRGFLRHQLGDEPAAEDLLQDIFVKALRQGRLFCSLDQPRAWLFKVARHAVIDRARAQRPLVPIEPIADDLAAPVPDSPQPIDALAGCVGRVLNELPSRDAEILRACDLDGMSQRIFAEAHGLSLPATKARLQRARLRLRRKLTQACQVSFDPDGSVASHVPRPPSAD